MQPRPEPSNEEVDQFIASHPGGAGFQEVAEFWGVSHQRIQQITRIALHHLHQQLVARGLTIDVLIIGWQGQSSASDMESHGSP